ncbi:MAG: hypothetical protein AABY86_12800 [Bdellovibrionota bacterium]
MAFYMSWSGLKKIFLLMLLVLSANFTQARVAENLPQGLSACGENRRYFEEKWDQLREQARYEDVSARLNGEILFRRGNLCPHLPDSASQELVAMVNELARDSRRNFINNLWQQISHISEYRSPDAELQMIRATETVLGETIPSPYSATQIEQFRTRGATVQTARAQTCTAVDLRRPPIDHVRNQGQTGWCYAYAAADLISFRTGELVSATDVANSFNRHSFSGTVQGLRRPFVSSEVEVDSGIAFMALDAAFARGYCLESEIPSGYGPEGDRIAQAVRELEQLVATYDEYIQRHFASGDTWGGDILGGGGHSGHWTYNRNRWEAFARGVSQCYFAQNPANRLIRDLFPGLDYYEFMNILHLTSRENAFNDFAQAACQRRRPNPQPQVRHAVLQGSSHDYFEIFDEQLNRGNIASISYQSSILRNQWTPLSGMHVSTVVGRRFNAQSGNCEYLIKNSYGPSCADYAYPCEAGMIWVPERQLGRGVYEAAWLD